MRSRATVLAVLGVAIIALVWLLGGSATHAEGPDSMGHDSTEDEARGAGDEASQAGEEAPRMSGRGPADPGPDAVYTEGRAGAHRPAPVRLHGVVLAPDKKAASHAELMLDGGKHRSVHIQTDERGRFDQSVPAGRYALLAWADGIGMRRWHRFAVDAASAERAHTLQLHLAATRTLTVTSAGQPLEGVRALLMPHARPLAPTHERRTDADGVARWDAIPAWRYRLRVFLADGRRVYDNKGRTGSHHVRIDVPAQVVVEGRVTRRSDGAGLAGARVIIGVALEGGTLIESEARTGADGRLRMAFSQGVVSAVRVQTPGYVTFRAQRNTAIGKRVFASLASAAKGEPAELEIALHSGLTTEGIVVDRDGEPVAGVTVTAKRSNHPWVKSKTDTEGRFKLTGLSRGGLDVRIDDPHHYLVRRVNLYPRRYRDKELRLVAARAHVLSGMVRRGLSEPVAGARVWITADGSETLEATRKRMYLLETYTDASGRWAIAGVPSHRQLAIHAATDAERAGPVPLRAHDARSEDITLTLRSAPTVVVNVIDTTTKKKIADASIRITPEGLPEGRERYHLAGFGGSLSLPAVAPGAYLMTASASSHFKSDPIQFDVSAGSKPVTLRVALERGITISGSVVDRTGKALRGAMVKAMGTVDSGEHQSTAIVDSRGYFTMRRLRADRYVLRVSMRGYQTEEVKGVTATSGRLRIRLRAK